MIEMKWVLGSVPKRPTSWGFKLFFGVEGEISTYSTRQKAMESAQENVLLYESAERWLWFPVRATVTRTPFGMWITPRGIERNSGMGFFIRNKTDG